MSGFRRPPLYEFARHASLGVGLAVIILNQVLILDAVAPDALAEHAETIWIATWVVVSYALLPVCRYVVNVLGRVAEQRFFGGESV